MTDTEIQSAADSHYLSRFEDIAKMYEQWANGESFGYVLERFTTCDQDHEHSEVIGSCWGYLGYDLPKDIDQVDISADGDIPAEILAELVASLEYE